MLEQSGHPYYLQSREKQLVGLDLSPAMLARAAHHVRRLGLDNVLLIRGDAHPLSFAEG